MTDNFKGIGEAKAVSVLAAIELGRRRRAEVVKKKLKVASSRDVFEIFQPILGDIQVEEFWILLLNRANYVIAKELVSKGGVAGTVADAKIIFRMAVDKLASSIILCHNHPSGNIKPSPQDVQLTKKLKEAGLLMDITVLDHLIIADTYYYSFADEGQLK